MKEFDSSPLRLTRRGFLAGASGGLFVLGAARNLSLAQSTTQSVLSGTEFNLEIGEMPVNFTGNRRIGTVVNGQVPAPLLRWREGDT
ncbi:MAG: copper resistance system multicopper oxidase, partial [Steroidobacter sp.]